MPTADETQAAGRVHGNDTDAKPAGAGHVHLRPLRNSLLKKLKDSEEAWKGSVVRFRALHWFCLTGIIVVPTCLASLKDYIAPLPFALLSVFVAICGAVQSIVKPSDKFMRDIEFRDEANYLWRQAEATDDPRAIQRLAQEFERVERQFHQGQHPWPVPKRHGNDPKAGQAAEEA